MSARSSSTTSTASNASMSSIRSESAAQMTLNNPEWPSICVKKGKWYDCLRPVPGYQGFGGMSEFSYGSRSGTRPAEEDENWTPEIKGTMASVASEQKGKKASR